VIPRLRRLLLLTTFLVALGLLKGWLPVNGAERTITGASNPNDFVIEAATNLGMRFTSDASAPKTTLPLWMYVCTPPHPARANIAARSRMGSRCLPPTLTPRRSAT